MAVTVFQFIAFAGVRKEAAIMDAAIIVHKSAIAFFCIARSPL